MNPMLYESFVEERFAAVATPPTVTVLGVPLALTDYEGALDWIDAAVAARDLG